MLAEVGQEGVEIAIEGLGEAKRSERSAKEVRGGELQKERPVPSGAKIIHDSQTAIPFAK